MDRSIKYIKDISLGDILIDGNRVIATMQIDNKEIKDRVPFYVIKNRGIDEDHIYVTGSHLILDNIDSNKFITVDKYKNAELSDFEFDYFICLITDKHQIKIGKETFWDWEDHFIKYPTSVIY